MFYIEPEPEDRIERIEKMLEKLLGEIDKQLEAYFEAYFEDLKEDMSKLVSPLREDIRSLLTLTDRLERLEDKLDVLAEDSDDYLSELTFIVKPLSEAMADIRAIVHEIHEQADGS